MPLELLSMAGCAIKSENLRTAIAIDGRIFVSQPARRSASDIRDMIMWIDSRRDLHT